MKKDYNRLTTSDMPLDSSFTPIVEASKPKSVKPKINAIGKSTAVKATSKTTATKAGTKTTTASAKTGTKTTTASTAVKAKITKDKNEVSDLEKLNEENLKSFTYNSKRSKVVIALLATLLVIAVAVIAVYLIIIKLDANCYLHVNGANAVYVINGEEMSQFRTPADLQGNRTLMLDIDLKISEGGSFRIKFSIDAYQDGVLLENTLAYWLGDLFYEGEDGAYYSRNLISGNQTIDLCKGVSLDYNYEKSLNANNFRMDFYVDLEKV